MARKVYTLQQRERLQLRSHQEQRSKTRVRELFNYRYRRSLFFRCSVAIRVVVVAISFYILNFNTHFTNEHAEILESKKVEQFYVGKMQETSEHKDIFLSTRQGNTYMIGFLDAKPDFFIKGDTLNIIRNIFNKISYVQKKGSDHKILISKYRRLNNYLIFVCFISFLTLLVADGYDFLFRVTIWIVLVIDFSAALLYLLI